MYISKFQNNVVKKYNKNIINGQIEIATFPCLCGNDIEEKFTKIYSKDRRCLSR